MKNQIGYIHLYCGNGKGKTTCGMGLCTRAAGHGYKVLIYQFMKNNTSSERNILKTVKNITLIDGLATEKFSFQLTSAEKITRKQYYHDQFQKLIEQVAVNDYDIVFFDEIIYAIRADLFDEPLLLDFLKTKPQTLEVVLTGQSPSMELIAAADYVSEIKKIKHPYDKGISSRIGIER
jgi:cob(I)alamin adenosyltransferase